MTEQKRELWTAVSEHDDKIVFDVVDENTGVKRQEERFKDALKLMCMLGGYPANLGALLAMSAKPWSFRMIGENMYVVEEKTETE
jgi:hypothetical protein